MGGALGRCRRCERCGKDWGDVSNKTLRCVFFVLNIFKQFCCCGFKYITCYHVATQQKSDIMDVEKVLFLTGLKL